MRTGRWPLFIFIFAAVTSALVLVGQAWNSWRPQLVLKTSGSDSLAISPDGRWLAVGSNTLVELSSGQTHKTPVACEEWKFSPNGRWVMGLVKSQAYFCVVDVASQQIRTRIPTSLRSYDAYDFHVTSDGESRLANDWFVTAYTPTGAFKFRRPIQRSGKMPHLEVNSVRFSEAGDRLLVNAFHSIPRPGQGQTLRQQTFVCDAYTGKTLWTVPLNNNDQVTGFRQSPDGTLITLIQSDGAGVTTYDARTHRKLWESLSNNAALSPNYELAFIALEGTQDSFGETRAVLRNAHTGQLLQELENMPPALTDRYVFMPDNRTVIVNTWDGVYKVRVR